MTPSPSPRPARPRPTPLLWTVGGAAIACAVVAGVVGNGPVAGVAFAGLVIALFVLVAAAGGLPRGVRGRRALDPGKPGPRGGGPARRTGARPGDHDVHGSH